MVRISEPMAAMYLPAHFALPRQICQMSPLRGHVFPETALGFRGLGFKGASRSLVFSVLIQQPLLSRKHTYSF